MTDEFEQDTTPDTTPDVASEPMSAPDLPAPGTISASSEGATHEPASVLMAEGAPAEGGAEVSSEGAGGDLIHYSTKQQRRIRDVLTRFAGVRRAARFYPSDHPAVTEGVGLLSDSMATYFDEGVDIQLTFCEGEILLGAQLMTEESVLFDQLVRDMTSIGVGSLVLKQGLETQELVRAVIILAHDAAEVLRAGGVERMMAEAGVTHMDVGAVRVLDGTSGSEAVPGEPSEQARAAFSGAITLMREMDRMFRAGHPISTARVKGVARSLVDNVLTNRYAMLQLTGLKNYDEYTFYHSANVAILSLALGSCVTNDYRFLSSLGVGALLHDIGKLSVGLEILNKPGALTPEEWADVRQHPVVGAEMTALLPGVDKSAIVTILEHHMRWDGTGYPTRTPRRKQHLASRIVAVADSYDAMTSRRSYSAARVQDEAMLLLAKSAGTSLDPVLVRLFVTLMGLYPPRSVVRLSDGAVAVVLAPGHNAPMRPLVRVITTSDGAFINPVDVDLTERTELTVKGCLDPRLLNIEVDEYL